MKFQKGESLFQSHLSYEMAVNEMNEKFYTGMGDDGTTDLISQKVSKAHPMIHFLGTMDEFASVLGLAKSLLDDDSHKQILEIIQQEVIALNTQVAGGNHVINRAHVETLEKWIDETQKQYGSFSGFVLPGENTSSASLHIARTIVRRAERIAVEIGAFPKDILVYLNRLSDLLYAIARSIEVKEKIKSIVVKIINQQKPMMDLANKTLNLEQAKEIALALEQKAKDLGLKIVIAFTDQGGNAILLHRMDDAFIASIDIAMDKAYTAVALKMTTKQAGTLAKCGGALDGLVSTDKNRLILLAGGAPLQSNGKVLGGLGISGGTADQDEELVQYGVNFLIGGKIEHG